MKIKYMGHSCFLFEGQKTKVLTDPLLFNPSEKQEKVNVDIVTISHNHLAHTNLHFVIDTPYIIRTPGEYEIGGTYITGLPSFHDDQNGLMHGKNIIYVFQIDGVRICHIGDIGHTLSAELLKEIEGVDVLLVPVGGGNTLNSTKASEVVRRISPRFAIPMHYQSSQFPELDTVETFLHEFGSDQREDVKELSVNVVSTISDIVDLKVITLMARYS